MTKPKRQPFRNDSPRAIATLEIPCMADPMLFRRWEDMPPKARKEFEKNGPIPCEGGGVPGEWCLGCRFVGEVSREVDTP